MIDNFVLIIGSMKCGTTSLFSYLSQHPEICACNPKEPRFFTKFWSNGFDWYQNLWDWNPEIHKVALEASGNYTLPGGVLSVPERVYSLKDKAKFKFIYIVRNPIERIESHYSHGITQDWGKNLKPLSEGIDEIMLETSRYSKIIEAYYNRFPSEDILLLNFDDLKSEPYRLVQRVVEWLGVNPNYPFKELGAKHNSKEDRIVNDRLWRKLRKNKLLHSLGALVPAQSKHMLHSLLGTRIKGDFKLSPQQRSFVLKELREDLQKLQWNHGVDVNRWNIEYIENY
jgi:hypothetical protein